MLSRKDQAQPSYEPTNRLVSVIVPTFNRADLLMKTIESCMNQTYTNIEIIVVDDGSTDRTKEVLENFSNVYSENKFRYFHQENRGPSSARNFGLDNARGTYVKFLDSDDTLAPDALAHYVEALEINNADLCIGSRNFIDLKGNESPIEYEPPAGIIENTLSKFFDLEIRPQTGFWLFKRSLFKDGLRWNTNLLAREDTELIQNILSTNATVAGAPKAIYNQRAHPGPRQRSLQFERQVFRSIIQSNQRFLEKLEDGGLLGQCGRSFARSMSRASLRAWPYDPEGAKLAYALAKEAYPTPELVLLATYPLGRHARWIASFLWKVGGVQLCGPLFVFYGHLKVMKRKMQKICKNLVCDVMAKLHKK